MSAIEAQKLSRIYQVGDEEVRALDGLTISLEAGRLAAVVGPSGSGKSTLMALLGGLDTPSTGTVSVYGQKLNGMDPVDLAAYRRSTVGFVFQDFFLLSHLTAVENVEVPLKLSQINRQERRARANELIKLVGLGHRGDHRPQQLSGGERQRVAIARALANRPKLLLADEPTGNLDEKTGHAVTEILLNLNKEQDITVVLVTHNLELADQTEVQFHLGGGKLQRIAMPTGKVEEAVQVPEIDFEQSAKESTAKDEKPEFTELEQVEPMSGTQERASAKVVLLDTGFGLVKATEIIREIRPDLSVFDIPGMLKDLPVTILKDIEYDKAEEIQNRFEAADCVVEVTNTSES